MAGRENELTRPGEIVMRITESQLRKIVRQVVSESVAIPPGVDRPQSFGYGDSPDPQDVWDAFYELGGTTRPVSETELAKKLGVHPKSIDYNGTTLQFLDGMVSETL